MTNNISFYEMRNAMLYHRIVEWKANYIRLDNGMELRIEERTVIAILLALMTEHD